MTILLLLLVFLGGAPQHPPELQLNLVAAPPPPPEDPDDVRRIQAGCGSVSLTTDVPPNPAPFKVTLTDTDRLAYEVGDAMVFTVIIENTSAAPLVLGISRDPHVAPKTLRPCRVVPPGVHFSVSLHEMRKNGSAGALIAFGSGYYGSPDVPGTTLALQPGERVRVQLPADIRPGPRMELVLTTEPHSVRIRAFVMIEGESLRSVYSDNEVAIELSQPIRRH